MSNEDKGNLANGWISMDGWNGMGALHVRRFADTMLYLTISLK